MLFTVINIIFKIIFVIYFSIFEICFSDSFELFFLRILLDCFSINVSIQ